MQQQGGKYLATPHWFGGTVQMSGWRSKLIYLETATPVMVFRLCKKQNKKLYSLSHVLKYLQKEHSSQVQTYHPEHLSRFLSPLFRNMSLQILECLFNSLTSNWYWTLNLLVCARWNDCVGPDRQTDAHETERNWCGSGNLYWSAWTTPSHYSFTEFGILSVSTDGTWSASGRLACFDSVESFTPICNHRRGSRPTFPPCGHFYLCANDSFYSKDKTVSVLISFEKPSDVLTRWAMFPHRTELLHIYIRAAGQLQCCQCESLMV